ncbi:MAG: thymidine kinase [Bradymonadales bacterium]|nr:MAG: thymidine kinase [Bradymonadales bacterium]
MPVNAVPSQFGWIEVITGSMFSGKTEELLRRIRRAMIAKQACVLVKPEIDQRYSEDHVVTHDRVSLPALRVKRADEIYELAKDSQVVGIDEAQFFDQSLVEVVNQLADSGKRLIVAGIDSDFRARPFDPIPELMASAEYVTKQLAICVRCGRPATRNQRIQGNETEKLFVGALESYEARCRSCFEPPARLN